MPALLGCPSHNRQGTDDDVISIEHGKKLHELCKSARDPLWLDGYNHQNLELHKEYHRHLLKFLSALPWARMTRDSRWNRHARASRRVLERSHSRLVPAFFWPCALIYAWFAFHRLHSLCLLCYYKLLVFADDRTIVAASKDLYIMKKKKKCIYILYKRLC